MKRYRFLTMTTRYWKPGDDYLAEIVAALKGKMETGDIVVFSEKAISTATGNITDENRVKPSLILEKKDQLIRKSHFNMEASNRHYNMALRVELTQVICHILMLAYH